MSRSASTKVKKNNEIEMKNSIRNCVGSQPLQEPVLEIAAEGRVINKAIKSSPLIDYQTLLSNENNAVCEGQMSQVSVVLKFK